MVRMTETNNHQQQLLFEQFLFGFCALLALFIPFVWGCGVIGPKPPETRAKGSCTTAVRRSAQWSEVKLDRLILIDAKTRLRHILLGNSARKLLASIAKTAFGEWMLPASKQDFYYFWITTHNRIGIVMNARLHDLHHVHASHAVMNGEILHVAGRLLGHGRAATTNHYVHLDDANLSQAAERAAVVIYQKFQ